jgi:3-oxoacyl-[acyl-carrier protein] reductase
MAQKILITAGAKGMGKAMVMALAAQGFDITYTVRTSIVQGEGGLAELKSLYPAQNFNCIPLDCANKQEVENFCKTLENDTYFGFVHNAGTTYDQLAALLEQNQAEEVMQVNYHAFTQICKALIRPMTRARAGRIIAIGSVTAIRGSQGNAAYGASKAALRGYIQTLAIETAKRGVTANYIAPGFIDTDMMASYTNYRETMEKQIPANRFGKPEEVAGLIAYLMSPIASYMTGATLTLDGGLTASMGIHR